MARRARRPCSTKTRGTSARRARCRSSTSRTRELRAALADAPKIGESLCDDVPRALRRGPAAPRRSTACRTCSTRRSCAASTTTRARRSSSSGRTRTPTRRSAAAGATTASSRRSAARRRPGSGSAPASSGCCSRSRTRASRAEPPQARRLLRRRRTRSRERSCSRARRAAPRGRLGRHRLRRPLVQGPDDAGRRAPARARS